LLLMLNAHTHTHAQLDVVSENSDLEALVLLFDPDVKDGFESVKTWWKNNGSSCRVNVKLCMAFLAKEGSMKTEDLSRSRLAREWCLDNGFELVCNVKKSCWVMDIDEAEGGECYGATGMSRVVEALSANMWSSMKRGKVTSTSASPPRAPTSRTTITKPTNVVVKKQVIPATKMLSESDALRSLLPTSSSGDAFGEDDEEIDDTMSNLFKEARTLREQATSGKLSDDERRDRAEAMMLRLMSAMGLDEDDDEVASGDGSSVGEKGN